MTKTLALTFASLALASSTAVAQQVMPKNGYCPSGYKGKEITACPDGTPGKHFPKMGTAPPVTTQQEITA